MMRVVYGTQFGSDMKTLIKFIASITYKLGRPAANATYKLFKSIGYVIIGTGSVIKTVFRVKK